MRIAILGAGGVGGYYGGVLARPGHDVVMLARGAPPRRLAGTRHRGPHAGRELHRRRSRPPTDPARWDEAEYAIVAVKNYSLPEIASVVRTVAEAGAVIFPCSTGSRWSIA